ncbi:sulfurtransferase complex subunit TusB [uncultured Cedecea sp.]|uniref:sulfurtransferase complex subunit TusB n=1 Tax=uncultured Cedecea sp. TaxID=988762 RepID=UPI002635C215|nr:sulfurtransferase complex subunit TusB [uncultured Cedecea sp.]
MLYTFRYSPFNSDISALLRYMQPGDCLLLTEDGVLAGLTDTASLEALLASPLSVYALQYDVEARGLSVRFSDKIPCISYTDFVKLTIEHQQQFAW